MLIPALSKAALQRAQSLAAVDSERGWLRVFDTMLGANGMFTGGAFQKDLPCIDPWRVQQNWTVFACQTLIAGDIGKLEIDLVEENETTGIYDEVEIAAFSPVLRKPNAYQTWQKFIEQWMLSKLSTGNAYILKERDNRNVVVSLYVLDPHRVTPLVAPDGSVYYQLGDDDLTRVPVGIPALPAEEIIHDRMWCLFHPLVGLSPIFACGLAAIQGLEIQGNQARFFGNASTPSGILLAPTDITEEQGEKLKAMWKAFRMADRGGTAVLGGDMKYQQLTQNAVDSQLVDQLKLSAEMICSTYHVPAYKVGVGVMPSYDNAEILNQIYYDDCLHVLIHSIESVLGEGLGLPYVATRSLCLRFNLEGLLRMDSTRQIDGIVKLVGAGVMKPNEGRGKQNMKPVAGGDSPMIQQQNYSLEALAKRDSSPDPFGAAKPPAVPALPAPDATPAKAIDFELMRREMTVSLIEAVSVAVTAAIPKQPEEPKVDFEKAFELMRKENASMIAEAVAAAMPKPVVVEAEDATMPSATVHQIFGAANRAAS